MPDLTPIFGLPTPLPTGEGADLPTAMTAQNERIEEVLAAGIRSSGKSIVAVEQNTSSGTYAELGTPDRVEDIVLPANGLILVRFQAEVKGNVADDPTAYGVGLFLDATQAKNALGAALEITPTQPGSSFSLIASGPTGLVNAGVVTSSVTTGQVVSAGVLALTAAADTYDVSLRFKLGGNSTVVTVKNRKLWVTSMAFGMPPP